MLAMSNDIRVLLVKLADRLHNMRTLSYVKNEDTRRRIAQETVEIYAPLAGRIGMQNMREELEDLAFAELDPQAREFDREAAGAARCPVLAADRAHCRRDQAQAGGSRHRRLDPGPGKTPVLDLAQAQGQEDQLRAAFRRVRVPRRRRLGRGLLPRARRSASHLADGPGALQGFHLAPQSETAIARSTRR